MKFFLIGICAGIISGMGLGGGVILIPAVSIFTNLTQKFIQGINLLFFIPTAIIAIITHIKNKNIQIINSIPLIIFGLVGAYIGAKFAFFLDTHILKRIFAGFLFFTGTIELSKPLSKRKPS